MIGILVITHGKFGEELIRAATSITGDFDAMKFITLPSGEDLNILREKLIKEIDDFISPEGVLIFTDMPGTTACRLAMSVANERKIRIVTGVNLSMLLSAITKRKELALEQLAEKIIDSGKKSITDYTT